ncbi:MAG: imidazolonepropionase [Phycisphaerales bacterium]|nr:imidazolonepropionase [Phycisphaerales bacterium]
MGEMLLLNARLCTIRGDGTPRRGDQLSDLATIDNGWLLVRDQQIANLGEGQPPEGFDPDMVIDLDGRVVLPAFVDCHTHACWAGSRLDEFQQMREGATYLEVLEAGGGILSTVKAVRDASSDELVEQLAERLAHVSSWGTGTVEIKSGYGLTTEDELKMLRAIHDASQQSTLLVAGTFLGAHALDPEIPHFVDQMIDETLPAVVEEFPGITCDAYCEQGAWSVDETVRLFERAKELGCPLRVHTDQFNELGMTQRAIELGARSVDHLEASSHDTIKQIGSSDTIAVLLPASGFSTDDRYADGRALVDAGAAIAVATNLNPGSAPCPSMPMAITLACRKCGLTPHEAIAASTYNAACVLGLQNEVGSLAVGHRADLVVLDTHDERELAWWVAAPPPPLILHRGEVIQFLANRATVNDIDDDAPQDDES